MNSQFSSRIKEKLYLSASLFQLFHFRTPNDFHIFFFSRSFRVPYAPRAFSPVYKKTFLQISTAAAHHPVQYFRLQSLLPFSLIKGTVTGNAGKFHFPPAFTSWNHKSPMRSSCCINHHFLLQTASGLQLHLKIFSAFVMPFESFILQDFNLSFSHGSEIFLPAHIR